ncbi:MAG: hypothetical protein M9927_08825 [Anaerolineae bacterium]|nr:hypothetical protein [Anaerolineae bacterium]
MDRRMPFGSRQANLTAVHVSPAPADARDGQACHRVVSHSEIGRRSAMERRLIPVRVHHLDPNHRVRYSFFVGICRHAPLTVLERSALLLLFPFASDGTFRDSMTPTQICLDGYEYVWYWCASIVAEGQEDGRSANMNVREFLERIDAFVLYLTTGDTQRIVMQMAQEMAYKGYFFV